MQLHLFIPIGGISATVYVADVTILLSSSSMASVHACSSSFYRGELSFLQPVHFCICWHNSAILTSYLFRQWPAYMCVPNWKNVLGVSTVIRCVW